MDSEECQSFFETTQDGEKITSDSGIQFNDGVSDVNHSLQLYFVYVLFILLLIIYFFKLLLYSESLVKQLPCKLVG